MLPVCECGNVPLARGLVVRGIAVPDAITFLLAAPILNPITIVVTYQASVLLMESCSGAFSAVS
jgi:uncharacterized membrane protein YraQ (UPF0718 family)